MGRFGRLSVALRENRLRGRQVIFVAGTKGMQHFVGNHDVVLPPLQATGEGVDQPDLPFVEAGRMGGSRTDAVHRLILKMVAEYLAAYRRFESDEMSDGDFQLELARIVGFYTRVLVGRL